MKGWVKLDDLIDIDDIDPVLDISFIDMLDGCEENNYTTGHCFEMDMSRELCVEEHGIDGNVGNVGPETAVLNMPAMGNLSTHEENESDGNVRRSDELPVPVSLVPDVGMKFSNYDAIYEFYHTYAKGMGFPIKKRSLRRGCHGTIRSITISCGREGNRVSRSKNCLKPQARSNCGCKARITATCDDEAVVEAGGYDKLSFIEKDCRNYVEQVRRVKLCTGDAMAIQAYFCTMQAKSDGFFYSMDLDENSKLKNLFWADKRSRLAYKYYGDVVTFDTTYLTNKYDMPFAPFVGVNHHGQSILLGCGLVCCEETESFVWLFQTWLKFMDGIPPRGIITDQDRYVYYPTEREHQCFFDGYVHSKTTLTQFVNQYERAMRKRVEDEFQADAQSFGKSMPCVTTFPMENQVQEVYTSAKFIEFRTELTSKMYCDISSCENGIKYEIDDDVCGKDLAELANLVADDEEQVNEVTEWIRDKVLLSRSRKAKNSCPMDVNIDDPNLATIIDPACSKQKGAPRKLRLKSMVEKKTRKRKINKKEKGNGAKEISSQHSSDASPHVLVAPQAWDVPGDDGVFDLTITNLDLSLAIP
ncbi:unnamed protein product [Cuscuta campestris]|uniref:Protein FAR1-RELATED SEQUENCE n=1 Tax=Cuscuta campestris TaxID=132261 RepID=A0A484K7I4_9ASTE|nr:unnamed protein product [Cuscuta campestris]